MKHTPALRAAAPTHTPTWAQVLVSFRAPRAYHGSLQPERVIQAVERALHQAALCIHQRQELHYEPQGLSYTVYARELTFVLHTWPEHGLSSVDLLLWGNTLSWPSLLAALAQHSGWRETQRQPLARLNLAL